MKLVLVFAAGCPGRGLQNLEILVTGGVKARIPVRQFLVPEIKIMGPGAKPVPLIDAAPRLVGPGAAREGVDTCAWRHAARGKIGGRIELVVSPPGIFTPCGFDGDRVRPRRVALQDHCSRDRSEGGRY